VNQQQLKKAAVRRELERVKTAGRGMLKPKAVVDAARPARNPLHSLFQWDDTKAAEEYRLWQAREIITYVLTVVTAPGGNVEVQAYVSLRRDRGAPGGGYRDISAVMANKQMRHELLMEAERDFETWHNRYILLRELVPVFEAMARVRKKGK
jgi:hypothetical protein